MNSFSKTKMILVSSVLVAALPALSVGSSFATAPATMQNAAAIYTEKCAKCHGADGKGQTKMGAKLGAKDYTDAKVQEALKDEAGVKAIKEGLKDKDGKQLMKPTEGVSEADAKALVAYMRKFKK